MNSVLTKSSRKIAAAQQTKEGTYWKKKLSGSLEKACFPLDFPQKNEAGQYKDISFKLPDALYSPMDKLSGQNSHALNIILVSGLALLLHKYTGVEDILLGQPVNKQSGESASINAMLILRLYLHDEMTFREVLNQTRQAYIEAVEHQNYPMDILSEELGIKQNERENAFFDIGIQLENIHDKSFALDVPVKIFFSFNKTDEGVTLNIRYDQGLFLSISIERIASHYFRLLEQAVHSPDIKLYASEMLTEEDRDFLLKVNNTNAPFDTEVKITDIFEAQAAKTPEASAVIGDNCFLNYAELNKNANRLARVLRERGIGPDTIVAIMAERSAEMMTGIVAILKAGGAYLPIDPNYPKARIEYILEDSGTKILLTQSKFLGSVEYNNEIINLDSTEAYSSNGENLERIGGAADLAYVIYTSGSTGKPKGAMIEHRSAINRINWMQKAYPISRKDVILQKTPISFDVSVWELFWWMFEGAAVCMLKVDGEKDPDAIIKAVERYHVTTMHFVPSMLGVFLDYVGSLKQTERLSSLRQVFASGEALTPHQVNLFNRLLNKSGGAKLINLYGPTEATVDVSHLPCSEKEQYEKITIGKPIDNIRLYVVDSKLRPQPIGVSGELCIAGIGLARGYLNRAELTREKFVADPFEGEKRIYRTGDLARWDAEGNIEYLGRIDHQVKIRGFRIELGEIEEQLRKNESVKDAVVIAREGANTQKYLCAYIIPAKEISKDALKESLSQVLPEYMVPSAYCFLDAFPLSPNGKLDRKALPEPSADKSNKEYVAPKNETEKVLTEIWMAVLGIDRVSITDNFFSLGGSSIHFISVLSKARLKGLNFTFQEFYQYPTIEKLAGNIKLTEENPSKVQKQSFQPFELLSDEDRKKLPEGLEDAYPLSMLQAGLIFQSEISKGTAFYHDIISYKITGPFDAEKFEKAVKIVVGQHPIFRTSYHLAGYSEYIQTVHKEVALPLYIEDLRGLTPEAQDAWYEAFLIKERAYRFKWEEPGLIRFHIQVLSDTKYRYNVSHHNSTVDGWSMTLIHTGLFGAYYALLEGKAYKAPKVDNHLRNHIGLEQEAIKSVEDKKFWEKVLSGHSFTQLPRWNDTPKSTLPDVCIVDFPLPSGLSEKIINLANTLSVPVKNVLMAAHMRLLSVLSGSMDVNTGYEHSGRPELEDADKAAGIFLNTIPFRINLTGGSWEDLIRQVYQAEIELLPHRRYPMAKMKQDLATQEPLFETAFNFTHFFLLKKLNALENFDMQEDIGESVTEFVLRTEVSQDPFNDQVVLNFHYHRNIFDAAQIEKMAGYFIKILQRMVENCKGQYLLESVLTDEEIVLQTKIFNINENVDQTDKCLHHVFEEQVRKTPDAAAIRYDGEEYTYDDLNKKANRIAKILLEKGVAKGTVVAVGTEKSIDRIAAMLAVFKTGGVYLPLESDYPVQAIDRILNQSACSIVLADKKLREAVADQLDSVIRLLAPEEIFSQQQSAEDLAIDVKPGDIAYIVFDLQNLSKGVMIEHRNLITQVCGRMSKLNISNRDIIVLNKQQGICEMINQLFAVLLAGGMIDILPDQTAEDAEAFINEIKTKGVTILALTPSQLEHILSHLEKAYADLISLRYVVIGGETLKKSLVEQWFKLYDIRLVRTFGIFEAAGDIMHCMMDGVPEKDQISLGEPVPNMNIYILDENLLPVPIGSKGEIYVSGESICKGYINNSEAEIEVFCTDPFKNEQTKTLRMFRTGNLGRWLPNGTVEYLGKKGEQVRVKGFAVEMERIEDQILKFDGIDQVAVIAKQEAHGGKSLAALLVSNNNIGVSDMIRFLKGRLPDYMIPSHFAAIKEIAVTSDGKVDRNRMGEIAEQLEFLTEEYIAPNTELEKWISQIWSEVLGIPESDIGLNDNFFNLGGSSLSAISLVIKSEGHISLNDIMKYPILGHLVEVVSKGSQRGNAGGSLLDLSNAADSSEKELNIICFPYGAGNAINYMSLSKALIKYKSDIGVYAAELPGHDFSNMHEERMDIKDAARLFFDEIKEKANVPTILFGHCAGCALALEVARLMKADGLDLKYVFLGGRLIRGERQLQEHIDLMNTATNKEIKEWLFSEAGYTQFNDLSEAQADFLADVFRHDAASASRYYIKSYDGWDKLNVPIIYIATDDDEMTADYMEFYKNWELFSNRVMLKEIEGGGHYFINTRSDQVAKIILDAWNA